MPDTKISALTSDTLASGDSVPIRRAGANFRVQPGTTGAAIFSTATKQAVAALLSLIASQRIATAISRVMLDTESGSFIDVDATAATRKITLPAHADGLVFTVFAATVGAGFRVNIHDSADVLQGELLTTNDTVTLRSDGTAWKILACCMSDFMELFNSSGSYAKKNFAKSLEVFLVTPGSGGGSGRRDAAGTSRFGGTGGSSSAVAREVIPNGLLSATTTVTIGAPGLGGQAPLTNVSNGNDGTGAGATSFGTHVTCPTPPLGVGGLVAAGTSPRAVVGRAGTGGLGSSGTGGTTPAGQPTNATGAGGSRGGHGISTANAVPATANTAGIGGAPVVGTAAGLASALAPDGTTNTTWPGGLAPGSGGGGAESHATNAPGTGGNGAPGAGGGGGAGFLDQSIGVARGRVTNPGSGYTAATASDPTGTTYVVTVGNIVVNGVTIVGAVTNVAVTALGTLVASGDAAPIITIAGDGVGATAEAMMQGSGGDGGTGFIRVITYF